VHRAVEANQAAIDAAGLHLSVDLPDAPYVLNVDPTRFVQVVSNLLNNAAKFTERGGHIIVSATVDSSRGESVGALTVRDTGVGIAPAILPRVFDLFVQADGASRGKTGLGIGLALARQLVEMQGGSIEAHSDGPGHGSTFTIRIPVVTWGVMPDEPASRLETPPSIARRVLIIDDNVDAADTLADLVATAGGQARTAYDAETGLRAARDFQPDAILLDIGMPGTDGYETCRRLRAEHGGQRLFIVAVTGWGQEHDKSRALSAGFDAHVTKPADPRVLANLLAEIPMGPLDRAAS
jgi:CheY-like chemotaxis protein